jgi:glycosyltransferase involved in cell wall biosynthesis
MSKYFLDTLKSIKSQTFEDWECIIVNDGSTDNDRDLILDNIKNDFRFKYYEQNNGGVANAKNTAAALSCGEFIVPLDPDDLISRYFLEHGVKYMDEHPECSLFYGRGIYFEDYTAPWDIQWCGYKNLLERNSIFNTSIFRRKDFEQIGGYNENLKAFEDWEMYIRLLYHNDEVYQSDMIYYIYRYRKNGRDWSTWKDENSQKTVFQNIEELNFQIYKEFNTKIC